MFINGFQGESKLPKIIWKSLYILIWIEGTEFSSGHTCLSKYTFGLWLLEAYVVLCLFFGHAPIACKILVPQLGSEPVPCTGSTES